LGKGKIIDKKTMCKKCNAKGTQNVKEKVDVTIEPGFPN